jgi:hypothetical protein
MMSGGSPFQDTQAIPVMSAMPALPGPVSGALRAFPALALFLMKMRAMGIRMTIEKMWGMVRRFGPQAVATIGGGLFTVDVLRDLMLYKATHKRRRMNVANTKALRRGLRRLKGFERLSHRVSAQLGRAARTGRRGRTSTRCGTCRRSPCTC